MNTNIRLLVMSSFLILALSSCANTLTPVIEPPSLLQDDKSLAADNSIWQQNTQTTWNKLQHVPLKTLKNTQARNAEMAAWIKLAIISKRYSANNSQLTHKLIAWRERYPDHPANELMPEDIVLLSLATQPAPTHIALLLPLEGQFAASGQAVREGFLGAAAKTPSNSAISYYDTSKSSNITALYEQAVREGADVVIGPLLKENVQTMTKQSTLPVPTLALNYTDEGLSFLPSNLYQFGLSPHDEAKQLAEKAREAGLSKAIIIAPNTEWGHQTAKTLIVRWKSVGGTVADSYFFNANAKLSQDIPHLLHVSPSVDTAKMRVKNDKQFLQLQRRQDFDTVFLLAPPTMARQIVPLLRFYYIGDIPIYATSVVFSGKRSPRNDGDLNGVIFADTPFTLKATHANGGTYSNRLYAVGRDSYLISQNFDRLTELANFPIYGATGALTLTPEHQIYRRVAWAKFHEGHP
jgi:outer membrane PBP1 activator LpoA protein